MDDEVLDAQSEDPPLKGWRQRWKLKSAHGGGASPSHGSVLGFDIEDYSPSIRESPLVDPSIHPSLPSDLSDFEKIPSGPTVPSRELEIAVTSAFASSVNWFPTKFPWEKGVMAKIFSDEPDVGTSLMMPPSWNSSASSVVAKQLPEPAEAPVSASMPVFAQHIKLTKNDSYRQQRDKTLSAAVSKWNLFLNFNLDASAVGRQILSDPHDAHQIIVAVLGTKSPNTALKRANSLMCFHRWASINDVDQILPFSELVCWRYVRFLNEAKISASRAVSFVQAIRFSHYVFQVDGALESSSSRRICGLSDIQLAAKSEPVKQARPLTVEEVKRLHKLASSAELHATDRCIVSHLLLMLYGRCRASDTFHVESIHHDTSPDAGYVDITTRCHKGSKAAVTKTMLLPIVIPAFGVTTPSWVESWWSARIEAGLPVQGPIRSALQPAPSKASSRDWTSRPLSSYELTDLLRAYLECPDDTSVSSHSLKATILSWASKCEMPRDYRRILGRHSSSVKDSDSVYSRELSYAPVRAMERMFSLIRLSEFDPDAARSKFFGEAPAPGAAPVFPPTPAFDSSCVAPQTPINFQASRLSADIKQEPFCNDEEVKTEVNSQVDRDFADERAEDDLQVSSSSEDDSSGAESGLSSADDDDDVQGPPIQPHKFIKPVPGGESPPIDEVWFQHVNLKTVHIASADPADKCQVTRCGRKCSNLFASVAVLRDWTLKCRVCFKGKRMPSY